MRISPINIYCCPKFGSTKKTTGSSAPLSRQEKLDRAVGAAKEKTADINKEVENLCAQSDIYKQKARHAASIAPIYLEKAKEFSDDITGIKNLPVGSTIVNEQLEDGVIALSQYNPYSFIEKQTHIFPDGKVQIAVPSIKFPGSNDYYSFDKNNPGGHITVSLGADLIDETNIKISKMFTYNNGKLVCYDENLISSDNEGKKSELSVEYNDSQKPQLISKNLFISDYLQSADKIYDYSIQNGFRCITEYACSNNNVNNKKTYIAVDKNNYSYYDKSIKLLVANSKPKSYIKYDSQGRGECTLEFNDDGKLEYAENV